VEKSRRAGWFIAAAVVFILSLTLFPTQGQSEPASACLVCGARGIADALLNIVLFMPLGAALAYAGLGLVRAVPIGFALTVAVELAQLYIPGRDSSLGDVVTNTLGTAGGVLLLGRAPAWLAWARRRAALLSLALPLATLLGLALGAVLLRPAFPAGPYAPAWHTEASHPIWFGGEVRSAELGGLPLLRRRIRDGAGVRSLWLGGAPLRLSVVRTPGPPELEPVFGIYDAGNRELLLVALEGDDVVFRYRTASSAVRLDEPELHLWGGAPRATTAGAAATPSLIELRRQGSGYCLTVDGRGRCGLGYGLARSWAAIMYPVLRPAAESALDLLFLFLLFLPSGVLLRRRTALLVLALQLLGLALIPLAAGLRPTAPPVYLAAVLGLAAGAALVRAFRRLAGAPQGRASSSPAVMASARATTQRSMRS
jgi:hypothetical protein